jgi:hypothetical protein
MSEKTKPAKSEIVADAWLRFERAVDVVAKSPPQHRVKSVKPKKRPACVASSKPKNA